MNRIKVSVIIPVYNGAEYLRKALDGVTGQTVKDIEIICVDDGSTDGTIDILKEYAAKDDRFRILYQTEKSDGAALARNMGIKSAKGEYLSILDADDLFEPDLLESCIEKAEQTGADIVLYDGFCFDTNMQADKYVSFLLNRTYIGDSDVFSPGEKSSVLFELFANAAWLMLLRRDFVLERGLWFRPVKYGDDIEFSNLALAEAKKIAVLNRRLVHYRYNAQKNQSEDRWRDPESVYEAFYHFRNELDKRGLFDAYKVTFVKKALAYIIGALDSVENKEVFVRLYKELSGGYLKKLGAFDIPDGELEENIRIRRGWISKLSYEDYLFLASRNHYAATDNYAFFLPITLRTEMPVRIIIYGAGKIGQSVYFALLNENDIKIVCWMDKKSNKAWNDTIDGVVSPEYLQNYNYDAIFVAVKKKDVFAEIKQELLCLGAEEAQIVWAFDKGGR